MSDQSQEISPANRNIFVPHAYPEQSVDLGEVRMNYVVAGSASNPALLLIPGQSESWWGYEKAISLLEKNFQVFAVDLRGQGRTTWTPGRYAIDNIANDLVRFISLVIKRPVITSGCSSGGVISAWLSAYSMPGQIRGACCEDPPLFASELNPLYGQSIRQAARPYFELFAKYLGNQWGVGDWKGLRAAMLAVRPEFPFPEEPLQNLKEYDPEWSRSFVEGTVFQSCPHEVMLAQVKTPILLTHHTWKVDPGTGRLFGALTDLQAQKVRDLVTGAGQKFDYVSLPDAAHLMHMTDPQRFADVLTHWAQGLR